jgi:RNA polymerase sigma factor (TIGR02999 family)
MDRIGGSFGAGMSDVTRILSAIEQGDPQASEQLLPLVYEELRRLAANKMAQEKPGQTLQATALVHDAYVRLVDVARPQLWKSRGHFFVAAAEAMRRILIDQARHKQSQRRGGALSRQPLESVEIVAPEPSLDILAVNEVLQRFEKQDPRCKYEDYARGLCLLDPYKLAVDWKVLATAGSMKSIEVFYNFMIMDANMNMFLRRPNDVRPAEIERINAVWGDDSWRRAVYRKGRSLFGEIEEKRNNEAIAEAFRKRLEEVAGFKYVPPPVPMRNSTGAVVYYLYFASPNKTGATIVEHIFRRYRKET